MDYNGEIKQTIQADLDQSRILWHNQAYSEIIQVYSDTFRTLCKT